MSDTTVSLLTAPGTGAIATVQVRGPRAWELARALFAPAGKPLPESPDLNRFWFGTLAGDEVVLATTAPDAVEVHCHGGPRVVRVVIDQFLASGCIEQRTPRPSDEGFALLQRAPTLRTAGIILDQLNGAFTREVQRILALLESEPPAARAALQRLSELGNTVGRHLVEPWKVVIAGPPNVGKSSLVNALAGYQRAVVSEVAGTTRDAVGVRTAFDGWPVELIDTAGLRDAEGLEAEGIARTRAQLATADRAVWVIDATAPRATMPEGEYLVVANKCDLPTSYHHDVLRASALTGAGLPELARALVARVPQVAPSEGVPYLPELIELVNRAHADNDSAARHLRAALELVG